MLMVENAGYKVHGTDKPEDSLALIKARKPDIVLLDIDMPELDGYSICAELKANSALKEIPVIFISALVNTNDKVEAFQRGGVDYITKPFAEEEVIARIDAHLSIKRSRDRMARINRNLRIIFSVISHDLRNPFVGLLSFPEIVAADVPMSGDELRELAECSLDQARSTLSMLDEMLEWARAQSNAVDMSLEAIDLQELADRVTDQAYMWAHAKEICIVNTIPEGLHAHADEKILSTVLRNLLSNAIKFSSKSGEIRIRTKQTEAGIELTVSDDGIGMSEKQIEELLSTTKVTPRIGTNSEQGTGIGMMLSQMLLQDMESRLTISSQPDRGSDFTIHLKMAE